MDLDKTIHDDLKQVLENWKEKYYEKKQELDKYKNIVDKALCFLETTERITNNPLNDEDNFERLWINYHEGRIENIDKLASILKGE